MSEEDYDGEICSQAAIRHFTCEVCDNTWVDDAVMSLCPKCQCEEVVSDD